MRSPLTRILLLLFLAAGLVIWQSRSRQHGKASPPASAVATVFSPLQSVTLRVGAWFMDVGRVMVRREDIRTENELLRSRLANAESQKNRLLGYQKENLELRKLLELPVRPSGKALAAEIVGYQATDFSQRVTLNVGSRHGVFSKDVVYCAYGLVGQVIQVSPFTSVAALITDRESGVGAMTARTFAKGIVMGSGERLCKFSYINFNADVREGDMVETSGLVAGQGAIYPRGLVVGKVLRVERDKAYSRLDAYIDPAVPFDRISAVFVRIRQ